MNKRGIFSLLLILICGLGLFFRTYHLSQIPQGFHSDEIVAGYVGSTILQTGKDVYGNSYPIYFDTFGDFRPTGIFYLTGLSAILFGLNEFSIRLPAALFGVVGVLGIYFLAKEVFGGKRVGIICAMLLAILPWHIVLSRATSEGIVGLSFCIWGIYFLYKLQREQNRKDLLLASLLLLVSMFLYHPFRVITPLLFLPFLLKKRIIKQYSACS